MPRPQVPNPDSPQADYYSLHGASPFQQGINEPAGKEPSPLARKPTGPEHTTPSQENSPRPSSQHNRDVLTYHIIEEKGKAGFPEAGGPLPAHRSS